MPTVTILLQSSRTEFFEDALQSVLAQTYSDLKIIVGDNTPSGEIIKLYKEKYADSKIDWHHAFPLTHGSQRKHYEYLLSKSETRYTRFVFDDDIIYPASTEILVSILEQNKLRYAYHGRHMIVNGALLETSSLLPKDKVYLMSRDEAAYFVFINCRNIFGEPSFAMFETSTYKSVIPPYIGNLVPRFLSDVINVLNMARFGFVGALSNELGAFRLHDAQESAERSPIRILGYVEWDLICRLLNDEYKFDQRTFEKSKESLLNLYKSNSNLSSQLKPFINSLNEIRDTDSYGLNTDFLQMMNRTGLY